MPHVIIKIYPGRAEAEKRSMAHSVAAALHETMGYKMGNVSVSVDEIEPSSWMKDVYEPDISGREDTLVKRPEYGPLAAETSSDGSSQS